MKKARHAQPIRFQLPGRSARHAKPAPAGTRLVRCVSLCVAAGCLLRSVTVYPASAATSMSSLQNKLDKLSQSIVQHKKELSNTKKKKQTRKYHLII